MERTSHQFTVSAAQSGTAGMPVAIDLSQQQRVLVSDSASGTSIAASFLAATGSTPITFTASPVSGAALTALQGQLPIGDSVQQRLDVFHDGLRQAVRLISRWVPPERAAVTTRQASASGGGGAAGSSASTWSEFPIGAGYNSVKLSDLTYDGTYASFSAMAEGTGPFVFTGGTLGIFVPSIAITGVAVLRGDANGDGRVDINDLTIVLTNFGRTGMTWCQGEFTGSGTVDINDLTIVLMNFGETAGSSTAGIAPYRPSLPPSRSCSPAPRATSASSGDGGPDVRPQLAAPPPSASGQAP